MTRTACLGTAKIKIPPRTPIKPSNQTGYLQLFFNKNRLLQAVIESREDCLVMVKTNLPLAKPGPLRLSQAASQTVLAKSENRW